MLNLLPYHIATIEFFKLQTSVWEFFANHKHRAEQLKEFKADLLKNSYKFDQDSHSDLFVKVTKAKETLGLSIPVNLYQVQNTEELNASIVYLDDEAHIVFSGKILQILSEEEQEAIIAHELSHVQLYTQLNGDAEVADRVVSAISNHTNSTPAHYETARLFKLYTEIFCDRGSYLVTGKYDPIITSLVKLATGLQTVNADSYIKQAEEIFSIDSETKASGFSHPENFIRARAIWLWHNQGAKAEPQIIQMIEGLTNLEELDLFKQKQLSLITKKVIQLLLQPNWMKSDLVISLSKQYFPDIVSDDTLDYQSLASQVELLHSNIKDYLAYVLYDFATVDKALEDMPLSMCFKVADLLHLEQAFSNAIKKELKLSDKKVAALKKQKLAQLQEQGVLSS